MRTLLLALTVLLPWSWRRRVLERWLGYELDPTSRIGLSWVFPQRLVLRAHARIGHLTVCKGLDLVDLGEHAFIGNLDWITGFPLGPSPHYAHQPERRPELRVGAHAAITHRHLIDCTNTVSIGAFTTLAGFQTQILTHSIDIAACRQSSAPVTVGGVLFHRHQLRVARRRCAAGPLCSGGKIVAEQSVRRKRPVVRRRAGASVAAVAARGKRIFSAADGFRVLAGATDTMDYDFPFPGRAGVPSAVLGVAPETLRRDGTRHEHGCASQDACHGRRDARPPREPDPTRHAR